MLVKAARAVLIATEVATVVIAVPIAVVIVVALGVVPVHAPHRVPCLAGTPVVDRHRRRQGVSLGGDTEADQPGACGNGEGGGGKSAERFHEVGYSRATCRQNAQKD